jgi:hypothetical protein
MTLNDRYTQARNVIMQQLQVLLEQLNTKDNVITKLQQYNKEYETSYKELKSNPDIGSEGWYQKRLADAYAEKVTLREDLKKWKEFGKLKDRAKMKVEGDRDFYKASAISISKELSTARAKASEAASLRALNTRQAQEYQDLQQQNADTARQNALLKAKVEKLQEIIEAGIKGLRTENERRQHEGCW